MTLRLPYMSPSRPLIGVQTAAASRVAVTAQEAFDGEVWRTSESRGSIGTGRVFMRETEVPHDARAGTRARPRTPGDPGRGPVVTVIGSRGPS